MPKLWTLLLVAGSLVLASPADAQRRDRGRSDDIPKAYIPPPGMCRVWLDDVPPAQQPAPTDCKTALRNKPAKARVIFGDDYVDRGKKDEGTLKGFKGRDRDGRDRSGDDRDGGDRETRPAPRKGPPWRKP